MNLSILKHAGLSSLLVILSLSSAQAQIANPFKMETTDVSRRANSMLALMSFSVVPDLTSSNLSMGAGSGSSKETSLLMSQFAGGDTLSQAVPVYMEGGVAYSRYDPTFVSSNGTEVRDVPLKWTSLSASGGIGYDFKIAQNLKLRPIFNFMLGELASDITAASWYVEKRTGSDFDFLQDGHMSAYGLGGSLMLDYEDVTPEREIDVEWRYSNVQLHSYGNSPKSSASGESLGLWTRWRAPTGMTLMSRPLRYVLEGAHTTYLGDQAGLLGFNHLTSVGAGFELDSSAYPFVITRTRLVFRYCFGQNVRGTSIGLAVSF